MTNPTTTAKLIMTTSEVTVDDRRWTRGDEATKGRKTG